MIYIHDEETGVTVEDAPLWPEYLNLYIKGNGDYELIAKDAADALLRGLLRWKLAPDHGLAEWEIDILESAIRIVGKERSR